MLTYVRTSLFDSPAQTLVNTVNTVGVMGKGIALEFKKRYPEMFERYKQYCDEKLLTVGKLFLYRTPNKWVLNFPTKVHWRNPSKLEYIEAGLQKFVASYTTYGIASAAFPQLGCGNGNLDWRDVRPLMERYLNELPIPIYVHVASPARDFVPEHLTRAAAAEAMLQRAPVGFDRFWSDLKRVVGDMHDAPELPQNDDTCPPEYLHFPIGRDTFVDLPREAFEELWHALQLRGALKMSELPQVLQQHRRRVLKALQKFDYIESLPFLVGRGVEEGIRFAPPADSPTSEPDTVSTQ